jgi:hypothetical protein
MSILATAELPNFAQQGLDIGKMQTYTSGISLIWKLGGGNNVTQSVRGKGGFGKKAKRRGKWQLIMT